MGFFDRFRGRSEGGRTGSYGSGRENRIPPISPFSDQRPTWMEDRLHVTVIDGVDDLEIVGESFYQEHLWSIVGGNSEDRVRHDVVSVLVAEHGNPHDENAISAWISGLKVGHLSRPDAAAHRPGLLALQAAHNGAIALTGVIVGGGFDDDGRTRMLGVFLNYDRTEFGLSSSRLGIPTSENLRTGLSHAVATDDADDSYDLGWRVSLPTDPTSRAGYLQRVLSQEAGPISRHFLFTELESTLYKLRNTSATALDDYDAACLAHDAEMNAILPVLVEKFQVVPLLDTYRQAAIRHQKAKDFGRARWWAERGIVLYGDRPANPEFVADLNKRAASYRGKVRRDDMNE